MKIKGAIFDLDGTLLDSMPVWCTAGERYLKFKGIAVNFDVQEHLKNKSLYQAAVYLKNTFEINDEVQKIMEDINKAIESSYFNDVVPKNGVVEFLEFLKENKVKMCIATATDRYLVDAALKRCNIRDFFGKIFTCGEVGHGKDEPHIFNEALEFLKTDKRNTYIFEDALYAGITAKKENFKLCGLFDISEPGKSELEKISDIYVYNILDSKEYFTK